MLHVPWQECMHINGCTHTYKEIGGVNYYKMGQSK